jgi:hypothetical protein
LFFFAALIIAIAFTTGINVFLTFTMSKDIAAIALMMLGIAIVLDFLVFRNIFVLVISISMKIASCCKCCHRKLSMGGKILKEIRKMMREVIKDSNANTNEIINIKEALEMEASILSKAPHSF